MGIVAEVLGKLRSRSGAEPAARSIADVEASLARLAAERNSAREAVATARAERDALLIVDQSDDRIEALDAAIERHHLTLERCDKLEPILIRDLQSLRAEARRRRFEDLCRRYEVAGRQFAVAFRGALEGRAALTAIREEAGIFAAERDALMPAPPFMTTPELAAAWDLAMDKLRDALAPKPDLAPAKAPAAPAPRPPAPKAAPAAVKAPGNGSRPPAPAAKAAAPPAPEAAPFVPEADSEGNIKIVILKAGFDLAGHGKPKLGAVIALPREQAYEVVKAAVGEFEGFAEHERRARR